VCVCVCARARVHGACSSAPGACAHAAIVHQGDSGRPSRRCPRSSLSCFLASPAASCCGTCPCKPLRGSPWRPGPGATSFRTPTCGNFSARWRGLGANDPRFAMLLRVYRTSCVRLPLSCSCAHVHILHAYSCAHVPMRTYTCTCA